MLLRIIKLHIAEGISVIMKFIFLQELNQMQFFASNTNTMFNLDCLGFSLNKEENKKLENKEHKDFVTHGLEIIGQSSDNF